MIELRSKHIELSRAGACYPAQRPGLEEKPDTTWAQISAKPTSFLTGSIGLERMWDILGLSKAGKILSA